MRQLNGCLKLTAANQVLRAQSQPPPEPAIPHRPGNRPLDPQQRPLNCDEALRAGRATGTRQGDRLFATLLRQISSARPRAAANNVQMKTLIDHARRVCTALVGVAAVVVTMANPLGPAAASPVQPATSDG